MELMNLPKFARVGSVLGEAWSSVPSLMWPDVSLTGTFVTACPSARGPRTSWGWRPVAGWASLVTRPEPRVSLAGPATPGHNTASVSAAARGKGGVAEVGEAEAVCRGGPGVTARVTVTRVMTSCSVTRGSVTRTSSSVTCPGCVWTRPWSVTDTTTVETMTGKRGYQ